MLECYPGCGTSADLFMEFLTYALLPLLYKTDLLNYWTFFYVLLVYC